MPRSPEDAPRAFRLGTAPPCWSQWSPLTLGQQLLPWGHHGAAVHGGVSCHQHWYGCATSIALQKRDLSSCWQLDVGSRLAEQLREPSRRKGHLSLMWTAPPRPRAWSSRVTRCHWFRAHCSLLACQTVTVTCDSCSEAVLNKCLPSTASGSEHNAPQRTPCRATRTGVTNHQPVAKKDPRNTCSLILKTMMVEGKN